MTKPQPQGSNFSDPTKAFPMGNLGSLRGCPLGTAQGSPGGHHFVTLESLGRPRRALLVSLNLNTYWGLVTTFNYNFIFKNKAYWRLSTNADSSTDTIQILT